jgi:phage/plasmid-like protein (TIGR03299 family)
MSHAVDSMFSVREMPWHYRQTADRTAVLTDYPETWDEARRAGGFLWEPRKSDLYGPARILPRGDEIAAGFEVVAELADGARVVQERIDDYKAVERDDTGARLGVVRAEMPLISHAQMGELAERFTDAWRKDGAKVRYETAGVLDIGRRVWALIRLDEPFQIPGDDSFTYPYFALTNHHDGTGACKGMPTNTRIVCGNTWSMADLSADATGHQVVIRHSGDVDLKIEEALATLDAIRQNSLEWKTVATELVTIKVTDEMVADFLDDFMPLPDGATAQMRTRRTNARATFMELYESPFTGMPGTAYGLLQTAGEYLDHFRRSNSADTYLSRTILKPEPAKGRALAKIRELTATAA